MCAPPRTHVHQLAAVVRAGVRARVGVRVRVRARVGSELAQPPVARGFRTAGNDHPMSGLSQCPGSLLITY